MWEKFIVNRACSGTASIILNGSSIKKIDKERMQFVAVLCICVVFLRTAVRYTMLDRKKSLFGRLPITSSQVVLKNYSFGRRGSSRNG